MQTDQVDKNMIQQSDRRFLSLPVPSDELLDLVGVPREFSQYTRVVDTQGDLAIIHYLLPLDTDGNPNTEIIDKIGNTRGVIVDTSKLKIVCRSYPYTPEVVNDSASLSTLELSDCTVFKACEGPILRVYWHDDKWNVSTHRKIDSAKSSWGGPPFSEMFLSTMKWSFDDLDKSLAYSFLLSHPAHRQLYKVNEPQLLLISVYDSTTNSFKSPSDTEEMGSKLKGCLVPKRFDPQPQNVEELCKMVDEMDTGKNVSFNSVGAIIINNTGDPTPVKVVTNFYNSLKQARGNDVNLRTRYILIRGSDEENLLTAWFDEPQYQQLFALVENEIDVLVERLHSMYMYRFIGKHFDHLPKEEFVVLQRCHSWHVQNRSMNKVTLLKMKEMVENTPNFYLLKMLNRQRVAHKQQQQPETD